MESCRASFLSILNSGLSHHVRYFGIGLEASDSLSLCKYLGFNETGYHKYLCLIGFATKGKNGVYCVLNEKIKDFCLPYDHLSLGLSPHVRYFGI
jgi:hypothetical protein